MKHNVLKLIAVGMVFLVPLSQPVNASFLKEAWNVVTDPLKIDAGTENMIHAVERTALHVKDLKKQLDESGKVVDQNIRDYLSGIDGTVSKAISGGDAAIQNALDKVSKLQNDIFANADLLIECSTEKVLFEAQKAIADGLNTVGKSKPRFEFLGLTIGSVKFTPLDIKNPIERYYYLQEATKERLSNLKPTDDAKLVEAILGDMPRIIRKTQCHYKNNNLINLRLISDKYEYKRMHQPWAGLVQ